AVVVDLHDVVPALVSQDAGNQHHRQIQRPLPVVQPSHQAPRTVRSGERWRRSAMNWATITGVARIIASIVDDQLVGSRRHTPATSSNTRPGQPSRWNSAPLVAAAISSIPQETR